MSGYDTMHPVAREALRAVLTDVGGDDLIESAYRFLPSEIELMRANYSGWIADKDTHVVAPDGSLIDCYAFAEGGVTRCDLRPLCEHLGLLVTYDAGGVGVKKPDGTSVRLDSCHPRLEGNQFTRADLRPLAESIGLHVKFEPHDDRNVVRLTT